MTLVYRTADEADRSETELLRHVLQQSLGRLDLQTPAGPHPSTELRALDAGSIRITEARVGRHDAGRCYVVRGPRHIARDDAEAYRVDIPVQGSIVAVQGGRELAVAPGSVVVTDLTRPAAWALEATRLRTLLVPRSVLPWDPTELVDLMARPFDADLGRVIDGLARALLARGGDDAAASTRLGNAIIDVLAVGFATSLRERDPMTAGTPEQALVARIYAFIEPRLGDASLTPATIAAAHHISLRYLYRLFESEELTVSSWIRRRRLEQAHRDLLDPSRQVSAAAIGARWGYPNAAHFSRGFKSEFGLTPGQVRRRCRDGSGRHGRYDVG